MLDRSEFKHLAEDIKHALEPVAEKYGITIDPGNISYTDLDATMKLKLKTNGVDYEKKKFNQHCQRYGFDPEDYLKEYTVGGYSYQLIGFNPKASKYPVIIKGSDGAKYKVTTDYVLRHIKKEVMA